MESVARPMLQGILEITDHAAVYADGNQVVVQVKRAGGMNAAADRFLHGMLAMLRQNAGH